MWVVRTVVMVPQEISTWRHTTDPLHQVTNNRDAIYAHDSRQTPAKYDEIRETRRILQAHEWRTRMRMHMCCIIYANTLKQVSLRVLMYSHFQGIMRAQVLPHLVLQVVYTPTYTHIHAET